MSKKKEAASVINPNAFLACIVDPDAERQDIVNGLDTRLHGLEDLICDLIESEQYKEVQGSMTALRILVKETRLFADRL